MSLSILPLELLENIFQSLSPGDLFQLSRTCFRCLFPAQRCLYRQLDISPAARNLAVLVTIVKKPYLARHVRSFSIQLASGTTVLQSYYNTLSVALKLMTELRHLQLSIDTGSSWLLEGVHPRSLTRFSSTFPLDRHVLEFLHHTPELVELELDSPEVFHTSPPPGHVIPNLQQFSGSCEAAESIVPGRPVHSLQLSTGDLTQRVLEKLAPSSSLAFLMATSSLPAPQLLRLLSKNTPELVYLRLMTTSWNTNDFSEANMDFYASVANALSTLSHLQTFELAGMHWGSTKKHEDSHEHTVWQDKPSSASFEEVGDYDYDLSLGF